MFTRPTDLADSTLARHLADGWAVAATSLDYVAVGFGSHHWSVFEGDRRWFVTVDDLDAKRRSVDDSRAAVCDRLRAALSAARFVADQRLDFVVAPIPAQDGTVLRSVEDRFGVAVYPFVDGTTYPFGDFRSTDHLHAMLAMVARLHDVAEPQATGATTDDLLVPRRDSLFAAIDDLPQAWDSGPFGEPARSLLDRHAGAVERLFEHYDGLTEIVAERPERMVLTHGEPHPANTLKTEESWLLVDWDTTLIAAPERDLWNMAACHEGVIATYQAMTGRAVDRRALDCYRLWWDLSEISGYVALLHDRHDQTTDMRESWQNLQYYLDPTARWPELLERPAG